MTDLISPNQWATIHHLVDWIDRNNGRSPHEVSLRILKITEEKGEVADAYLGATEKNEGHPHGLDNVADELCDVMLSAAVALVSVVDDRAEKLLTAQWETVRQDVRPFARCFLKIAKCTGRAASAYIGMTGQNPRKGVTHTAENVADELCDVILAAALALVSVTGGEAEQVLSAKLAKVAERAAKVEARDAGLLLGQGA